MKFANPWILEFPSEVTGPQFLIVSIVGLLFVLFMFFKVIRPMLAGPLAERQKDIAEAAQQVESTLSELNTMIEDYRSKLAQSETDAEARMSAALDEAEALRSDILKEAQTQVEVIRARAVEEVSRERAKVFKELGVQGAELSINAARAAADTLTTSDRKRLVNEFIVNLGAAS